MSARPAPERALRVLLLTNHFRAIGGSETVTLEVAEWFRDRGDVVTIGTNIGAPPMADCASGITLQTTVEDLEPAEFDLVWCHHDVLSLMPLEAFQRMATSGVPHVVLAGLSPTHPYEHVNAMLARALRAEVWANSEKTADAIAAVSHGRIRRHRIHVFYNAAPAEFWDAPPPPPNGLRSLAMVSNHPPPELVDALAILADRGIAVRWIGRGGEQVRVRPADLDATDAVVTIGKTVNFALARNRPVYNYDRLGGHGWLTTLNWSTNLFHNFAGHPDKRTLTAAEIADEIIAGFPAAAAAVTALAAHLDDRFRLDTHLAALRRRVVDRWGWPASLNLRRALASPAFRANLELANRKSILTRRFYVGFSRSSPPHSVQPRKWWS